MIAQKLQKTFDILAVSLSALCLFHCLALPLIILSLPYLPLSFVQGEGFHLMLLGLVIPTSAVALMSSKQHLARKPVIAVASVGLSLMILAIALESVVGERGEVLLTTVGGIILAAAHIKNYFMCRQHDCCGS